GCDRSQRISQTAERRPADGRGLKGSCGKRRASLQHAFGRDARQERRRRRTLKCYGGAENRRRCENLGCAQPPCKAPPGQKCSRKRFDDLAELNNAPAIVTIGDMAREQRQERCRKKLSQPNEAKLERAVGEGVKLPTERDRRDLIGKLGEAVSQEVE